jgi:DNA-binding NarL/FixJ family response regulator
VHCSPRQAEILALVARGLSDKQIANQLQLSPHTVRSYLNRFLHDHGLANRAAAAVVWLKGTEGARSGRLSRPAVVHRGDAHSR